MTRGGVEVETVPPNLIEVPFLMGLQQLMPTQITRAKAKTDANGRYRFNALVPASYQVEVVEASHPVPDERGVAATRRILDRVSDLAPDDTVVCLLSGGGSSLLCAPAPGVTLAGEIAAGLPAAATVASHAPDAARTIVIFQ